MLDFANCRKSARWQKLKLRVIKQIDRTYTHRSIVQNSYHHKFIINIMKHMVATFRWRNISNGFLISTIIRVFFPCPKYFIFKWWSVVEERWLAKETFILNFRFFEFFVYIGFVFAKDFKRLLVENCFDNFNSICMLHLDSILIWKYLIEKISIISLFFWKFKFNFFLHVLFYLFGFMKF